MQSPHITLANYFPLYMKLIFLDIEGVLNSVSFFKRGKQDTMYDIDPNAVALVNYITNKTDANIVVTSSMRLHKCCEKIMRLVGLRGTLIKLPHTYKEFDEMSRGNEIKKFINSMNNVTAYCIIDDDESNILEEQKSCLIKVSDLCGITEEDAKKALEILKETC